MYPENADANAYLGRLYLEQGKYEEARRLLKKALSINPYDTSALESMAAYCKETGDFKRAQKLLNNALKINPNSAQAHLDVGDVLVLGSDRSTLDG